MQMPRQGSPSELTNLARKMQGVVVVTVSGLFQCGGGHGVCVCVCVCVCV